MFFSLEQWLAIGAAVIMPALVAKIIASGVAGAVRSRDLQKVSQFQRQLAEFEAADN